jgi:hypothetical protein
VLHVAAFHPARTASRSASVSARLNTKQNLPFGPYDAKAGFNIQDTTKTMPQLRKGPG